MTEEEWLLAADPNVLLESLTHVASCRKLRIFATACCFQNWDELQDPRYRNVVLLAERMADGLADEKERRIAETTLLDMRDAYEGDYGLALDIPLSLVGTDFLVEDACESAWLMANRYFARSFDGIEYELGYDQASYVRDIFANPFRPVTFDARWRTSDVVGLAQAIYEDKAFTRMPILADALMDAGCEDERIIAHCRGEGPHVRGCWVVDLLLGKT